MSDTRPLTAVYEKLETLVKHNKKETREYKNTREVLIALLHDEKPDDPDDLKSIIKRALNNKDGEIIFAALQSAFRHQTVIKQKYTKKIFQKEIYEWLSPYLAKNFQIEEYCRKLNAMIIESNTEDGSLELKKRKKKSKFAVSVDDDAYETDRLRSASSTSMPRPSDKAPTPQKLIPLTVMFKRLKEIHDNNGPDKSVYNNYRKALIILLQDEIPDSQEDLGQIFNLAKETKDYEIIDAIITPFIYKPITNGKLLDEIIDAFIKLKDQHWFVSFFVHKPYQRKLERVLGLAFDTGHVGLDNIRLEKLLKMALKQNDFKLVAKLLAAPPANKQNLNEQEEDNDTKKRTSIAFSLLSAKIKECYANYSKDNKKSLFWLVSIREIIENDELLDLKGLNSQEVIDIANLSLDFNNIQLVETWVKACPGVLENEEFKKRAAVKYKAALKDLLRDEYSRNGFGMSTILAILDSKVLDGQSLDKLFSNEAELFKIMANLDIAWREIVRKKLVAKGALKEDVVLEVKDKELEELSLICLEGSIKKFNEKIIKVDFSKLKYKGKSLLHYVVSYDFGDQWALKILKTSRDEQEKSEAFLKLSRNKNLMLQSLLDLKKFSKEDIQEAFNTVYREGEVSAKEDKTVLTAYANRGDERMAEKLYKAGAHPEVGKTFTSVWKAIAFSQAASFGLDFVLGVGSQVAQHYTKIPFNNWYKKVARWISGGTGALTFQATGAIAEAYNRNLNPDYYKNNFLDLSQVVLAGTYSINWYGKVKAGEDIEDSIASNAGYTNVKKAISSEVDITSYNHNVHHDIAQKLYTDYLEVREKEKHQRFNFVNDIDEFKQKLELMNKKCQYGIPGDDGYSFNREFQSELCELFSDEKIDSTVESIMSTKQNQSFFLDLARGVEQGLIKTTLELRRRILEARDLRQEVVGSVNTRKGVAQRLVEVKEKFLKSTADAKVKQDKQQSRRGVLQQIQSPINGPIAPDVPFRFGRLRRLYDAHSEESIPFSVLLVAQFYRQLGISRTDRVKSFSEKSWDYFVYSWQGMVGRVSPIFGLTQEEGNKYITRTAQALGSAMIGYLSWYDLELRNEMAQHGILKSMHYFCNSVFISVEYAGIPPLIVFPILGTILAGLLCRHFKVNPIAKAEDLASKLYNAVLPTPDPHGIFINKSTRDKFEALYKNMRSSLIPEVAGMAV